MTGLWRFFSSVYLTIALAIAICAVPAWGSIISMQNPQLFRAFDQEVLFPLLFSLGTRYLGQTLWVWALIVLTAIFALNTAVCTFDKVLAIVRNRRPWQAFFPHLVCRLLLEKKTLRKDGCLVSPRQRAPVLT